MNSLAVNSGTTGWCFGPNLLASAELHAQQSTSPYPTANARSACPAFGIGNIDTSDHTLSTAGFTTYVDGSYTSLLPGGQNDYTLLGTSPGHVTMTGLQVAPTAPFSME